MAKPGSGRAPGRGSGGPSRGAGGPSDSFGPRPAPGRSAEGAREDNPWRRAALGIERDRERNSRDRARIMAPQAASAEEGGRGARADGRFVIGRLGATKGLDGSLRVQSYSGETEHFLGLSRVELLRSSKLHPETRLSLRVERIEEGPGGLEMAFEGYGSPEKAEALVGMEILVERSGGAPLGEGEWYVADLVGLALESADGSIRYGRVLAVCEGGPDPWLEVELDAAWSASRAGSVREAPAAASEGASEGAGSPLPRALVPFRKEFIGDIDPGAGRLVLLAPWVLE